MSRQGTIEISSVGHWSDVTRPEGLLDLVDHIMSAPPYSYLPGEVREASDWFPALVTKGLSTLLATSGQAVVGYCLAVPAAVYPAANEMARTLGLEAETTGYVAELGVAEAVRRAGVATTLIRGVLDSANVLIDDWLVRTLAENAPAIDLYRKQGFRTLTTPSEIRHGRPRVWMRR